MNKTTAGHIAALITIVIWGTTFISTKILLVDFTPIEILFFRFLLGLLVLIIVYPKRLKLKDRKQEFTFAAAGLCGICLYYLLENIALTVTTASMVPVITVAASVIVLKEKITWVSATGTILTLIGLFLLESKLKIKKRGKENECRK